MSSKEFKLDTPLPSIFPKSWTEENQDFINFRNLEHFRHVVSGLTQKHDDSCGISYKDALRKLIRGESDFPEEQQESIRNLVRENLHKRGLITAEVYENYRYNVEGTTVGFDVGKYAAGEPDCVITPSVDYIDFFYELYVSISYAHYVDDSDVRRNIAKLLATVEELERRHIFIKVTLVLPVQRVNSDESRCMFSSIPLFSHKDTKSVKTMSSVVNDRLLRKFYFAVMEDVYGENLSTFYGCATAVEGAMNVGNEFNEIDMFTRIVEQVGAGSI